MFSAGNAGGSRRERASFSGGNPSDIPPVSFRIHAGIHPSVGIPDGFMVDPGWILLPVTLHNDSADTVFIYP